MTRFINQTFIVVELFLPGFGRSLATKCLSNLNDNFLTAIPTLRDLNPNELHHYPFMVSLDKGDENCNTIEDPFLR